MPGRLSVCVVSQPVARFGYSFVNIFPVCTVLLVLLNCISATTIASGLLFSVQYWVFVKIIEAADDQG